MSTTTWPQSGTSGGDCCTPPPANPAPQPKNPDTKDCKPPTPPEGPKVPKPDDCAAPDQACNCPRPPRSTSSCLDELSAEQAKKISKGDKAKEFKTDLDAFSAKAKVAVQDYTRDKYQKMLADWKKEDQDIAELIRKLVCALPCWKCVIECYVCPLLNDLHNSEKWLYGDGSTPTAADTKNLYDLRYWYDRAVDARQRQFDRVKAVLAAWNTPAATIDKAMGDNRKLITDIANRIGSDAARAAYDLFFKVVPMHLAIAPPAAVAPTLIDAAYTDFCKCDKGAPDDCCGPDVGPQSLRQRLIGAQPYLIDPCEYFDVICCLVRNYYEPAKEALSDAQAMFQDADGRIKAIKAGIDDGLKSLEKNAKGAMPAVVDCCGPALPKPQPRPPAAAAAQ